MLTKNTQKPTEEEKDKQTNKKDIRKTRKWDTFHQPKNYPQTIWCAANATIIQRNPY